MTPEFLAVELLFNRADASADKNELLRFFRWELDDGVLFCRTAKTCPGSFPVQASAFFAEYMDHGSRTAAYLLLKIDGEFALKKLDDQHVVKLLGLLKEKTAESEKYALDLLTSPRSDAVWKMAGAKLYEYAGETAPEKNVHHTAMSRFIPGQAIMEMPIETAGAKNCVQTSTSAA